MTQAAAMLMETVQDSPEAGCPARSGERSDEVALIERARGDAGSFGELYRGHYPVVAGYLLRRTGDRHAAEDLASETFLSAWKALPRYRERGVPFRAWLMRIATNKANRWSRDVKRGRTHARVLAAVPTRTDGEGGEAGVGVQRALLRLGERDQSVLVLHHVEGLSVRQVSEVLGMREGTVKSRLSRARARLRDVLEALDIDAHAAGGNGKEVS